MSCLSPHTLKEWGWYLSCNSFRMDLASLLICCNQNRYLRTYIASVVSSFGFLWLASFTWSFLNYSFRFLAFSTRIYSLNQILKERIHVKAGLLCSFWQHLCFYRQIQCLFSKPIFSLESLSLGSIRDSCYEMLILTVQGLSFCLKISIWLALGGFAS